MIRACSAGLTAILAFALPGGAAAADSRQSELLDRALESYQADAYEQAIELLGEANALGSRADAYLLTGMVQLKNGDPDRARESFSTALSLRPTEFVRDSAQTFIRQIKDESWQRATPFLAALDLSAGGDSNYFEDGNSLTPASVLLLQGSVLLGYRFPLRSSFFTEPSYTFLWDEILDFQEYRVLRSIFHLPLTYSQGAWFLQLVPRFASETLGTTAFMTKPAARVRLQYGSGSLLFGLDYDVERANVLDSSYSYLAGTIHAGKAYFRKFLGSFDYSILFLGLIEAIGDQPVTGGTLPLANRSFAPGLAIAWYPSPSWRVEASGYYYIRSYTHAILPGGASRSDQQLNFAGKISFRPRPTFAFYLAPAMIANSSNLGAGSINDRNYLELSAMGGIQWEPFR